MRLICGLWHLDGRPAASETLEAMTGAMIAAGLNPRIKTWRSGSVGLAVVDFSSRGPGVELPQGADGRVLAADVRLDEPEQLARMIGGGPADEESLLLAAVERWSAEAPLHLLGDYAFAAWTPRSQRFLCARDALGIRPFVYAHRPGRLFAFASLPRALHGAGLIERKIDEAAFARRFVRAGCASEAIFTDIRRLPAGHTLEISADGVVARRYWRLQRETAGARRITAPDAAEELRGLIERAVRCRLPHAGPVAAHLSGGLDSTAVAILAARRLRENGRALRAYSFLVEQRERGPANDETPYVDAVRAQESGLEWTRICPPAFPSFLAARMHVDRVLSIEPDDPENAVCRDAAAHGAEIVLSGWGGDEGPTFNARGVLAEEFLRGHWRYVAGEAAALARVRGLRREQIYRGEILSYLLPEAITDLHRRLRRPPSLRERLRRALTPGLAAGLGDLDAELLSMGPDGRRNRLRLLAGLHLVERAENWATIGSRYGQAFVFPLLDRRLVEFALSLPSALFLRDGFKRRVFRDAMAGILPELIRWRHDKVIALPDQLIAAAAHRDAIVRRLTDAARHPRVRAVFDVDRLRAGAAAVASGEAIASAEPGIRGSLAALYGILPAIAYMEQHG